MAEPTHSPQQPDAPLGIAPEATLTVERTSPADVQNRQVYVRLNGAPFATLLYGKSATRAIEPGTHTLVADNTWKRRKLEFTVAPDESVRFQVSSRPGWGYSLLVGFFGAAPMEVAIERIEAIERMQRVEPAG